MNRIEVHLADRTPADSQIADPAVTVIIPAYNEEQAIAGVIREVHQAMTRVPLRYEILVVDDGSTDATFQRAKGQGVRVLRRPRRMGSGMARRIGVEAARGGIVAMIDADGSYRADDIPRLLECLTEYDQVNGARQTEEGNWKWIRTPVKHFIRKLACYLARTDIPDLNTGLKVFKRSVMMQYLWALPAGFSCTSTMTLAFLCNGHSVAWVPVPYRKRIGVSKFHPVWDTFSYLLTVLRMILYFKPLSIFLPAGLLLLALSLAKAIQDVWFWTGKLGGVAIVSGIGGIVIIMVGLIADLIVAQGRKMDSE